MADVRERDLHKAHAGGSESLAIIESNEIIGFVDPLIGRTALRDVQGYFGFPIIRAGETVTQSIAERAQALGRLYELTAATDDV